MKKKYSVIFLSAILIMFLSINRNHAQITEFTVSSVSMEPSLHIGDRIEVVPAKNIRLLRGFIIAYYPSDQEKKLYLHRCIAIEGDTFSIKNGSVFLNDKKLTELYTKGETNYYNYSPSKSKIEGKVPDGMVVVLGDNRENSADSRFSGYVPFSRIKGIARRI